MNRQSVLPPKCTAPLILNKNSTSKQFKKINSHHPFTDICEGHKDFSCFEYDLPNFISHPKSTNFLNN